MYSQRYCGYVGSDMKLEIGSQQAALDYAGRGWSVLPLLPNKKDPHFDLCQRAYLSATTDQELINFWFDYDEKINTQFNAFFVHFTTSILSGPEASILLLHKMF